MRFPAVFLVAAAAILTFPSAASAQEPLKSFDQLNTRLKVGDTVWVTDAQGLEIKGRITLLGPSLLVLDADGPRSLTADQVVVVKQRTHDSVLKGTLIGAAVGAAGGAFLSAANENQDAAGFAVGAALGAGCGAGIGAIVDALVPGKKLVAYRAPDSTGLAHARLSIAPVITPRARGVAVSFAF